MSQLITALFELEYQPEATLTVADVLTSVSLPFPDQYVLDYEIIQAILDRDTTILKQILNHYHTHWKNSHVTITLASDPTQTETIRGDANLIESIDSLAQQAIAYRSHTSQKKTRASDPAIIIRSAPQPRFSGQILSFNPVTQNKNQFIFSSTNGVYDQDQQDHYSHLTFDIRSQQRVATLVPAQPLTGVRRTDYTDHLPGKATDQLPAQATIITLISMAQKIARVLFAPIMVQWEITAEGMFITGIARVHSADRAQDTAPAAIATGVAITHFSITGDSTDRNNPLLIVDRLTYRDLPHLKQAAAILAYQPIRDESVLQFIKQHHIPCLVSVSPRLSEHQLTKKLTITAPAAGKTGSISIAQNHQMLEEVDQKKRTTDRPTIRNQAITPTFSVASNDYTQNTVRNQRKNTAVAVLRWQKNPFFATATSEQENALSDGAIFSYDFLLQLQGTHPIHLAKKDRQAIQLKIIDALQRTHAQTPVAGYQTSDLHLGQLSKLQFAPQVGAVTDTVPENPAFAIRGGLQILFDATWFETEVTALAIASKKLKKDIPCIVPFIRTVSELLLVGSILEQVNQAQGTNIPLYLRIDLPAQIHQLPHLIRPLVKGLVINIPQLQAISFGIDHLDPFVARQYSHDTSLSKQYMAQITSYVQNPLPVWAIFDTISEPLIAASTQWGIQACITRASHVAACRNILEEQSQRIIR